MIYHYLKIAFRNMWKYKGQTLVSVVGLAVGFVCFAMSTLWIRHEMTYDNFHRNADRIYCLGKWDALYSTGRRNDFPRFLAGYLKSTFPEIANAITALSVNLYFKYEDIKHNADFLMIDSSFFSMFDVRIVEGSMDFLIPESKKLAITRDKALQLFGNESPVGKHIKWISDEDSEICAVVTGLPKRSNYSFDFLQGTIVEPQIYVDFQGYATYMMEFGDILVETVPGIDIKAFEKKLNEHDFSKLYVYFNGNGHLFKNTTFTLIPLTEMHYKDPSIQRDVQFQHIIIFAVAGSLLILCTLFNYLTLFLSRFRMRQRELALRTVYGASGRSLFAMLSVEFIMSFIIALLLGMILIDIVSPHFMILSKARLEVSAIYLETVIYIAGIIVVALTVFFLTLVFFRRRTLNASIRGNKKIFRKTSIVAQLIISIVFAFCTIVILKQMYYLHNSADLGFSFKNRGSINPLWIPFDRIGVLDNKIKQIPEIKETLTGYEPLLPIFLRNMIISDWDGKQGDAERINLEVIWISEQFAKFYEFELIEGDFVREGDDEKYVLINESAAKTFGWDKPVGKVFGDEYKRVVKGVVKDIYCLSPTIAAKPFCYIYPHYSKMPKILFKYEGDWKICLEKIKKIVEKELPKGEHVYYNDEEEYNKYLKSENTLLSILTILSTVCIMVCIFGFVSQISLTCEERRKEIAIRKINGATVKDILDIFFKEYLTLLAVGAAIAFPAGYIIMKRWLQNYVIQTEISAWVYVAILLALILVIIISVGGKVWRTSRENPINALNR